ncbi:hypothetical protein DFK10_16040 [Salibaculum griseiflavum]|uniref:Uncharacterized protein n=1 Tax=Salibaculum griseiflavum TaxID=1914409 RepID=A0A2V1P0X1_9RHOB|nr:hypothetical protein DFK10_16040 [Salibaculum griseiflavum]
MTAVTNFWAYLSAATTCFCFLVGHHGLQQRPHVRQNPLKISVSRHRNHKAIFYTGRTDWRVFKA